MRRTIIIIILIILFIGGNILIYNYFKIPVNPKEGINYGVTFSKPYALDFGLDWKKTYLAILDDLGVKRLRIPVYWNLIEPQQDSFNFTDLDWQISEAKKRGASVILVIGRRVPRWPECFVPNWAEEWNETAQQERIFEMLRKVVLRYKDEENVWAWQVENEPFLNSYGNCPKFDKEFFEKELEIVKSLDKDKKIIITESGELSTWLRGSKYGDILGISLYRVVWNDRWGYFNHFFPTFYYDFKGWFINQFRKKTIFISEMQAEPWGRVPNPELPIEEQFEKYNINEFNKSLNFVARTEFKDVYFWGVEWWYWLKEKQDKPEFWERGKELFK